jgi:hypothetical protein
MHDLAQLLRDAGGNDPRLALAAVKALEDEHEWLLVRAVRLARAAGYDWGRIGRLLGVSRQAARRRFDHLAPKVGPTPPHTRGRTPWEAHAADLAATREDVRRRREFESGDAVFW